MRRQHTGRPGTAVIPSGWETAHRVVVERTMRGRVSLREPGSSGQTWSEADEAMVATPLAPYATDVPARIQALSGQARVVQLADDTEVIADYLVVVPAAQVVATGHLADVTTSGDPDLTGRTLRVEKVARGTERFERDLFCTLDD
jgi:hypothetical protein